MLLPTEGNLAINLAHRAQAALLFLASSQELANRRPQRGFFSLWRAICGSVAIRVARLLRVRADARVARRARRVVRPVRRLCRGAVCSRDTRSATLRARASAAAARRRGSTGRRMLYLLCRRGRVLQHRLWDVDHVHATAACQGRECLCHAWREPGRHWRGGLRDGRLQLALDRQIVVYRGGAGDASAGVPHGKFVVIEGVGHRDGPRYPTADGLVPGSWPLGGGGRRRVAPAEYFSLHVDVLD